MKISTLALIKKKKIEKMKYANTTYKKFIILSISNWKEHDVEKQKPW